MQRLLDTYSDTAAGWERALYSFLAEKERRSGSRRTVASYSRMIQDFFGSGIAVVAAAVDRRQSREAELSEELPVLSPPPRVAERTRQRR